MSNNATNTTTTTQQWIIVYENEHEEWEVEGWEDFVSEHDGSIYASLEDLDGLTETGIQYLNTCNIETTADLLGHALIHHSDIASWLISIGFKKDNDGFDEFANGIYQRLVHAGILPTEDEEEDENINDNPFTSGSEWCVIS